MKKLIFITIAVIWICMLSGCNDLSRKSDLEKAAEPIEKALIQEGYEKQRQTEVYDFTFANDTGSEMVYYICLTTYYASEVQEVTGLDTEALCAVFSPDNALLQEELTIAEHPAAWYQGEDRMYLCCTSSPETTLVLEYDPVALSREEAFRIMESVFVPPEP